MLTSAIAHTHKKGHSCPRRYRHPPSSIDSARFCVSICTCVLEQQGTSQQLSARTAQSSIQVQILTASVSSQSCVSLCTFVLEKGANTAVSICTFVLCPARSSTKAYVRRAARNSCQYLYFCTGKAELLDFLAQKYKYRAIEHNFMVAELLETRTLDEFAAALWHHAALQLSQFVLLY